MGDFVGQSLIDNGDRQPTGCGQGGVRIVPSPRQYIHYLPITALIFTYLPPLDGQHSDN